ncbi:hypothetical protein CN613_25690 [Bacillus pseudomycoides]|uniref:Phage tail assembly protein n=1 Tax=Bacillus pseudomycoides TaxID=64104 RepID=A0A2A8BYL2_9BACI|nr:hypothetical protein [Bacillus pseudomycoides]PEM65338.1 hypothetical protein CN613_25690 [Bacillus pseudomycoides]
MANTHKGIVEIELDKKRNLHYTLNALAEIEDKLGIQLQDMASIKLGMKNIRSILWAGLLHEDAELTEEQVGSFVDMTNFADVQAKVNEAFSGGKTKN